MALAAAAATAETGGTPGTDVRSSWEDMDGNADILEKQLQRLKVGNSNLVTSNGPSNCSDREGIATENQIPISSSEPIVLDSTREESLRTQYVPPEPKLTILSRPKQNSSNPRHQGHSKNKSKTTAKAKSLEQREQEYAAARMRILGDVRFEAEEAEAELEASLSPAELLKLKIAEAMRGEESAQPAGGNKSISSESKKANGDSTLGPNANAAQNGPKRNKRSREKVKTVNPEPVRDFPVHKTDSDRIIRHPRGPDGSSGFTNYRS